MNLARFGAWSLQLQWLSSNLARLSLWDGWSRSRRWFEISWYLLYWHKIISRQKSHSKIDSNYLPKTPEAHRQSAITSHSAKNYPLNWRALPSIESLISICLSNANQHQAMLRHEADIRNCRNIGRFFISPYSRHKVRFMHPWAIETSMARSHIHPIIHARPHHHSQPDLPPLM